MIFNSKHSATTDYRRSRGNAGTRSQVWREM